MNRSSALLVAALICAGCDRPGPAPRATEAADNALFDNAAASRSIMQPAVIAESAPLPAASPTPPPVPTGATVLFVRGVVLDDAARGAIDRLLGAPGLPADARWVLRGSSDTDGSNAANLKTSRRRALAVQSYLVEKGIVADRITVIALGDGRPVAPNVKLDGSDDPAGRARNRRVDIEIVTPAPPVDPAAPASIETALPTPTATSAKPAR